MTKTILITGATGFVGRALLLRLARDGHRVLALVRDPARARHVVGDDVELIPAGDDAALVAAMARADAVVNLAGESIIAKRWTAARKRALLASRVGVTETLARAAARRATPLPVLVSASAVGIYGDRGDERIDERFAPGAGFAAELCRAWELAARGVGAARTVLLRIGVVLGPEGGVIAALTPAVRARVAGRLGSGRQWMSWIHVADLVEMIATALDDDRWRGTVNAVAPEPVTNATLTSAIADAFGGAARLPAPAFALRAVLGERAHMLLDSQRVFPRAAEALGFRFAHPLLVDALADVAGGRRAVAIGKVTPGDVPGVPYLDARRPRYVLESRTELDADLPTVFRFFSDAGNLELLTPPTLGFRIVTPRPIAMHDGATIDYALRLGGIPLGWRTVIERWEPGASFVDAQTRGPYRAWWHEHRFVAQGDRTLMVDRVYYAPPLGPLGRVAHRLFIKPTLERIFCFRRHAIRLRFGG
jgi:uncharacterized protein (TIGR01777 family)